MKGVEEMKAEVFFLNVEYIIIHVANNRLISKMCEMLVKCSKAVVDLFFFHHF